MKTNKEKITSRWKKSGLLDELVGLDENSIIMKLFEAQQKFIINELPESGTTEQFDASKFPKFKIK